MTERVVIIGGGFGGLEAAFSLKELLPRSAEITVINRVGRHSFIPSIHLIVSGKSTPAGISIPLKVLLGAAGIRFVLDEALSVDPGAREVIASGGRTAFDHLILCSGATNNFFEIPGAEEYSCRFRTPEDAERIHDRLVRLLRSEATCRIVLAGAGTEGVEVVGEVLDLVRSEGRGEDLVNGRISVELVEGKSVLLPAFPAAVRELAGDYLRKQGVRPIAGDRIAEVLPDRVLLSSGRELRASILIWSGGIQPSGFIKGLPFEKDPWGWLKVNDLLQVPSDRRVYGIGDGVSISTEQGPLSLQRLAYHARDQARVTAMNIAADISGGDPTRYEPRKKPQLISLGADMGVFTFGERVSAGPWVVSLKKAIERKHLLAYLSRPLSSSLLSRAPGAGVLRRLRARLPL